MRSVLFILGALGFLVLFVASLLFAIYFEGVHEGTFGRPKLKGKIINVFSHLFSMLFCFMFWIPLYYLFKIHFLAIFWYIALILTLMCYVFCTLNDFSVSRTIWCVIFCLFFFYMMGAKYTEIPVEEKVSETVVYESDCDLVTYVEIGENAYYEFSCASDLLPELITKNEMASYYQGSKEKYIVIRQYQEKLECIFSIFGFKNPKFESRTEYEVHL